MHDKIALIPKGSTTARQILPLWKKSVLASAAALVMLGMHLDANALALGAIQVKSALGEPLRAEIEIPDITAEEASTFQATLGTPQEFQSAGVDYSQALRGTRISLQHRPNGGAYLRVEGQQPVNEPFLGIVIDANWANGHTVRDYTLLVDPRAQSPLPPEKPAQLPVQNSAPASAPATQTPRPSAVSSAPSPSATAPGAASEQAVQTGQVRVQRGDTAASIAQAHQADGVSLDQMLVAMLRANPQAFIRGNVNLIRAGAVIDMPSADQASAVPPSSARRTVIAQSRDFRAYRQGLAAAASHGVQAAAGRRRSAAGSIQPQVQETDTAPAPQDRLTLSRGKAGSSAGRAETRIAQSRHAKEQAAREAELNRNISELSQLAAATGNPATAAPTSSNPQQKQTVPGVDLPAPAGMNTPASSSAAAATSTAPQTSTRQPGASATAAASAAPAASSASSSPRPVRSPVTPPPPPPEPSLWDTLQDNLGYIGGLILVLLLGGYVFYRRGKRSKTDAHIDGNLFSDSKLPTDSFFGNTGGQHVDTREGAGSGASSSMAYSPSQLEAAGDVDPVSEADVYLAYGRDAQAEEILKEALRTYPGRASIYAKLAEIYAKRRDPHLFGAIATEAQRVTRGEGHDWQIIARLGSELDPGNPLYSASSASAKSVPRTPQPIFGADTELQEPTNLSSFDSVRPGVDLDLTDNAPLPSTPKATQSAALAQAAPGRFPAQAPAPTAVNFASAVPAAAGDTVRTPLHVETVNFTPPTPKPPAARMPPPSSGMMEFDMDTLSAAPNSRAGKLDASQSGSEPLATKLALAQEFHSIGDNDGARNLVKEVLAEASGALKIKAARFLSELG